GDDAIVIVRKPLRLHETLTSASRAADKIRITRGPAIKGFRQRPAHNGHVVNAEIRVVDDALPVLPPVGVERETAAAALVPRVRRAGGKAARRRPAQAGFTPAEKSAAAVALESSVPVR